MKKRKFLIIIIIVFVLISSIIIFYIININKYNKKISIIEKNLNNAILNNEVEIEYGTEITYDYLLKKYISIKKIDKKSNIVFYIDDNKIRNDQKYSFDKVGKIKIVIEMGYNYKYKIFKTVNKNIKVKKNTNIIVKDTKNPILEGITDKEIYVSSNIDLKEGIKAYDEIDGPLDILIEGNVDNNKPGIYSILVKAVDKNGNESSKTFNVTVMEKKQSISSNQPATSTTSKGYKIEMKNGLYYINGILIANKSYPLSENYSPGGLLKEFTNNFNLMKNDAKNQGINLNIVSGYRSYSKQESVYNNYVAMDGKNAADTYSARPGHSEHQTGLAADINSVNNSFINTPEGKWLNDNCYKYGFIIRYPKGKESITGYIYEPWHIRYINVDVATELYNNGDWITLEEYLGINSSY